MVLSFTVVLGMTWSTSQRSTIRPTWPKRKMPSPRTPGLRARSGGRADHLITVGECPHERDPLPEVLLHRDEVVDRRLLLAVFDLRVVLGVGVAGALDGVRGPALIEHRVIEVQCRLLASFLVSRVRNDFTVPG